MAALRWICGVEAGGTVQETEVNGDKMPARFINRLCLEAGNFTVSLKLQDELQTGSQRRIESKNMSQEWNQVCVSVQGQNLTKIKCQILKFQQQELSIHSFDLR